MPLHIIAVESSRVGLGGTWDKIGRKISTGKEVETKRGSFTRPLPFFLFFKTSLLQTLVFVIAVVSFVSLFFPFLICLDS